MRRCILFTVTALFSLQVSSQSFLGPAVRVLAKKLIPAFETKAYVILTEKEISMHLPQSLPSQSEAVVYKSGYILGVQQTLLDDPFYRRKFEDPYTEEEKKAMRKAMDEMNGHFSKSTLDALVSNVKISRKLPSSYRPNIRQIQWVLKVLGYRNRKGETVEIDGILGNETKAGIEALFGIDCTTLNEKQIIEEFVALRSSEPPMTVTKYDLVITNKSSNEKIEMKELSEKMLNQELDKLTCSLGEVCADINKKTGSVEFDCEKNGNSISINISTKGSFEIGLKTIDGTSAKFYLDKNGKMKITASDKRYSRSVTSGL